MSKYFECRKGCVKCCEDPRMFISPTIYDIVRLSEHYSMSLTQFFNDFLTASAVPPETRESNEEIEVMAALKMPCPYIGEVADYGETIKGCTIQGIKPITCAAAPEERMASSQLSDYEWDYCRLKPLTKKKKKEISRIQERKFFEIIVTDKLLYTPKIKAPKGFLRKSKVFIQYLGDFGPEMSEENLMKAYIDAFDLEFSLDILERLALVEEGIKEEGSLSDLVESIFAKKVPQSL